MSIRSILTLAVFAASLVVPPHGIVGAKAESPTPWPESARGRALPRPGWVLVIPARRKADGGLAIWERADPWTKAWRVPKLVQGIRMVTLLGDAEDRRSVTAEAIDGMLVDSLSVVMRKYGAPALALAVSDGDSVSLAGYVPGVAASWRPADAGGDIDETRVRSLAALAAMFTGRGEGSRAPSAQSTREEAQVLGVRDNANGSEDYKVSLQMASADARPRLERIAGVRIVSLEGEGEGAVAVLETDAGYDGLAQGLRGAGFSVR